MFNKKRIVVTIVFILLMFFMMTFAGSPVQNEAVATRLVTFTDGFNNEVISQQKVEVGKDAEVPDDPEHRNYVFVGWYLEEDDDIRVTDFTRIMQDLSVVAKYAGDRNNNGIPDEEDTYYNVVFFDTIANAPISTQRVLVGTGATAPAIPTHDGYTFAGWSRGYANVQGNITVNTIYTVNALPIPNVPGVIPATFYNVTFVDGDTGDVISTQSVREGLAATAPSGNEIPVHENRVFIGWDGSYDTITGDTVITALYADDLNGNGNDDRYDRHYNITFEAKDNGSLEGKTDYLNVLEGLTYGQVGIKYPNANGDTNFVFDAWSEEFGDETVVSENKTYYAAFIKDPNKRVELNVDGVDKEAIVWDVIDPEEIKNQVIFEDEYVGVNPEISVSIPSQCTDEAGKVCHVTVTLSDDLDNRDTAIVDITINKRPVTVTIDDKSSDYGDSNIPVELTSNASEVQYQNHAIGVVLTTEVNSKTHAGDYAITGEYTNRNYDVTFIDGNYKIKRKKLTEDEVKEKFDIDVEVENEDDAIYDGEEHESELTVNDPDEDLDIDGDTNPTGTDVDESKPENKVVITCKEDGNYECDPVEIEVPLVINPRKVIVTANDQTVEYTGVQAVIDTTKYTVSNLVGEDKLVGVSVGIKTTVETINAGEYANAIMVNKPTATLNPNYTIETVDGNLKIKRKKLTEDEVKEKFDIDVEVENEDDAIYDGEEHESELTVNDPEGDLDIDGDTNPTGTDVDESKPENKVVITCKEDGNYECDPVEIEVPLVINPRKVIVTASDQTVEYTGSQVTVDTTKYTVSNLVGEDKLVGVSVGIKTTVEAINAGEYANAIIVNKPTATLNPNYTIETVDGNLEVTRKELSEEDIDELFQVNVTDGSHVYDGETHESKLTVVDPANDLIIVGKTTVSGVNVSDSKTSEVTIKCNPNGNYSCEDVTKTIKLDISRREVKVKADNQTVGYTGSPVTIDSTKYKVIEGLIEGDTLTGITVRLNNNYSKADYYEDAIEVNVPVDTMNPNYTIKPQSGNLTIGRKSIVDEDDDLSLTLVNQPNSVTYDGTEHKFIPVLKDGDTELVNGIDYIVTYRRDKESTTDFVNVGIINVMISGMGDYAGYYELSYNITPREVEVTALDQTVEYTGVQAVIDTTKYTVSNLVEGDTLNGISVRLDKDYVEASTYEGAIVVRTTSQNPNYNIKDTHAGKLVITSKSLTKEDSEGNEVLNDDITVSLEPSKVYDGTNNVLEPIVKDGDTVLVNGTDYTLDYGDSDTKNVGTVTVIIKGSNNYSGEVTKTYQITPKQVAVETASDSKDYDGTPLTKDEVTISGLVSTEESLVTINATGTITDAGSETNTYSINWNGVESTNYTITETLGTLTINKKTITTEDELKEHLGVYLTGYEGTYDASTHSAIVTNPNDIAVISNETGMDITNYGEHEASVVATCEDNKNYDCGEGITLTATMKVNRKEVTVTAQDSGKVYGTEDPTLSADVRGTLNDDKVEYNVTRVEGESVGEYAINVTGEEEQGNYHVTFNDAKFNITKASKVTVTINGNKVTKVYNGLEQTNEESGKPLYTVVKPDDVTVTFIGEVPVAKGTNASENPYAMGLTNDMFIGTSDNYDEVEFVINDGSLTITPLRETTITVTGNSAEYVYDGEEKNVSGYTTTQTIGVINSNIVDPTIILTYAGSASVSKTNAGIYAMGLDNNEFSATSNNYEIINIEVIDGSLKINKSNQEATVTITGHNDTKEYTGSEFTVSGYDVTKPDETTVVEFNNAVAASITASSVDTHYMGLTSDMFTATSNNYNTVKVEVVDGYLKINPKSLTKKDDEGKDVPEDGITVINPNDVVYNSDDQKELPIVKDGDTELVNGTDYTLSYSGDTKNVGTVTVTITGKGNYSGTLTATYKITPATATVTADNQEMTYGHTTPTFTARVEEPYEKGIVQYTISLGDDGETINVSGEDYQGNYKVNYIPGKLTVHRANINISVTSTPASLEGIEYGDYIEYKITIDNTTGDIAGTTKVKLNGYDATIFENVSNSITGITTSDLNTINSILGTGADITVAAGQKKEITIKLKVVGNPGDSTTLNLEKTIDNETTKTDDVDVSVEKTIKLTEMEESGKGTNIVLVIDASGSMYNDVNRIKNAKKAAQDFITSRFENGSNDIITVITFSTLSTQTRDCLSYDRRGHCNKYSDYYYPTYANVIGTATDSASAATLKTSIGNISTIKSNENGGTPYYIALEEADKILFTDSNALSKVKPENDNVVIFLTDGEPDSTDDVTKRNAAITSLKSSSDTKKAAKIYGIAYATNSPELNAMADQVFTAGVSELSKAFKAIERNLNASDNYKTSHGVKEISSYITASEKFPIEIYINGELSPRYTYTSVNAAVQAGVLIGNATDGYKVNAAWKNFAAGDKIEFVYYVDKTKTIKPLTFGSLYGKARVPVVEEDVVETDSSTPTVTNASEGDSTPVAVPTTPKDENNYTPDLSTPEETKTKTKDESEEDDDDDDSNGDSDSNPKVGDTKDVEEPVEKTQTVVTTNEETSAVEVKPETTKEPEVKESTPEVKEETAKETTPVVEEKKTETPKKVEVEKKQEETKKETPTEEPKSDDAEDSDVDSE